MVSQGVVRCVQNEKTKKQDERRIRAEKIEDNTETLAERVTQQGRSVGVGKDAGKQNKHV